MKRLLQFGFGVFLACMGFGSDARADEPCYDVAVVGRIIEASNFVPLDQLIAEPEGDSDTEVIYFGGRLDLRVRVSRVIVGDGVGRTLDVRAIMASLPTRRAVLVFFLRRHEDAPYEAVHWRFAVRNASGRYATPTDEPSPNRCDRH